MFTDNFKEIEMMRLEELSDIRYEMGMLLERIDLLIYKGKKRVQEAEEEERKLKMGFSYKPMLRPPGECAC